MSGHQAGCVCQQMDGVPHPLLTLQSYKNIAQDSQKRDVLFRDSAALQFFALCLMDPDPVVVTEVLQVLLLICDTPEHCTKVASLYGVVATLNMLASNEKLKEQQCQISKLRILLQDSTQAPVTPPQGPRKSFFVGSINLNAKTVVLYVEGLFSQNQRRLCEEHLVKIKGVISITFNLSKSRCILRTKNDLHPKVLAQAISEGTGFKVSLVIKGENGEELVSFDEPSPTNKDNQEVPAYLPEEENSPVRDQSVAKKDSAPGQSGSGWISSAANFLTRSFYW